MNIRRRLRALSRKSASIGWWRLDIHRCMRCKRLRGKYADARVNDEGELRPICLPCARGLVRRAKEVKVSWE